MRNLIMVLGTLVLFSFTAVEAHPSATPLDEQVNKVLSEHYAKYKDKEYFSGIAIAIAKKGQPIDDYYIGEVSHDPASKKMDASTFVEIGSITKSFTASIILQLEKEHTLQLQDTLQHWLPEYNKWGQINIAQLLNMTSGLPNYSDAPLVNAGMYQELAHKWANAELIQAVYPPGVLNPPLKSGYFYSNTGYILAAMIIEKITQQNFQTTIENRLIKPAHLNNTFYPIPTLDKPTFDRLAQGYGYNPYDNPELVGMGMKDSSLSWAGAAGAVISNPSDIVKWIRALFTEDTILDANQKQKLMRVVSTTNGKSISKVSSKDPRAFGLGVSTGYDPAMGQYWFYEGETEGFRALYMYVPSNGVIISSIFNSAVNTENDHAGELMKKLYGLLR